MNSAAEFRLEVQGSAPVAVVKARPLRSYQREIMEAWRAHRGLHRGHMIVAACGLGKTRVAAEIAREEPGRVLFLVNRDKLARQSLSKFLEDSGRRWELEKADDWAKVNGDSCVVATVQSLKAKRLERFAPDAFSLVIADEVHMLMGKTYRRPLEYFTEAKLLGLTATPDRTDRTGKQKGYRGLFDNLVIRRDLTWAINNAWSTPLEGTDKTFEAVVDLSDVKFDKATKDFQIGSLDEAMAKVAAVKSVVIACFARSGDRRTVVFCPGVQSAIAVTDALNAERPGCARVIYGDQDTKDGLGTKNRNMEAHQRGDFQFLVNCMILTVGYDDERLQHIVDAAPTTSRALAEQKYGRPARLWPGLGEIEDLEQRRAAIADSPKPFALITDLAFNTDHELAGPADVLGGSYTDKERKKAKEILAKTGGDVQKALEKAREAIVAREARAQALKAARGELREVRKTKREKPPEPRTPDGQALAMTPGQCRAMTRFGIPWDINTPKGVATQLCQAEYGRATRSTPSGWLHEAPNWPEAQRWLRDVAGINCTMMSNARAQAIKAVYIRVGRKLTAGEILETARSNKEKR